MHATIAYHVMVRHKLAVTSVRLALSTQQPLDALTTTGDAYCWLWHETVLLETCQKRDWHLRRSIDGLSREEASEVRVCSLSSNLQLALQVGDPALHEMHIVQEHPASFLGVLVQYGLCWALLTLHTIRHSKPMQLVHGM